MTKDEGAEAAADWAFEHLGLVLSHETSVNLANRLSAIEENARREEREACAAMVETHAYVFSNVRGGFMELDPRAPQDQHHRTIAATIRARSTT
jgi:hypothetical protein